MTKGVYFFPQETQLQCCVDKEFMVSMSINVLVEDEILMEINSLKLYFIISLFFFAYLEKLVIAFKSSYSFHFFCFFMLI